MCVAANPWTSLPPLASASYVLPADSPYINCFNRTAAADHSIVTNQVPEPWLGPASTAKIFVLQKNPRYLPTTPHNPGKHPVIGSLTCPHYGISSGDKWWRGCFATLARDVGHRIAPGLSNSAKLNAGYKHLELCVCSVEYFPYGSDRFAHSLLRLPSQAYSFDLVRQGICRGATIVVLKGWKEWLGAVPELCSYAKVGRLNGFLGAKYITPGNCPPGFYEDTLMPTVYP